MDGIGKPPSAVTRELGRNASEKGHRHKKAQRKAGRRMMMPGMWEFIKTKMREDWTPEQIEGRCRRDGIPMVSRETLYKEFAKFGRIRQALGIKVYFAKPYHSWERGTNENRNGVVRKVLPKGRPFDDITGEEMRRIDRMLNDRPLKCLNWRTSREAFTELLRRHLLNAVS